MCRSRGSDRRGAGLQPCERIFAARSASLQASVCRSAKASRYGVKASRYGVAAVVVLTLTSACGRASRPSLDADAVRYVRLAAALGERDSDSLDFYAGPADRVAEARRNPPTFAEIKREAETLSARLSGAADPARPAPPARPSDAVRARSLAADLAAVAARAGLLTGSKLPYDKESELFFGLAPRPLDERQMTIIRSQIADIAGRGGRLVDRYAAFAARFTIPADRLPAVMRAAVDECRRRTLAHVALPSGEGVALEFVRDRPWSAFSRYLGDARSVLQINADFRFTVDQALQAACHEGYPGHHARNARMAPRRDAPDLLPERSIQLTFSPESLASEASAMLAADVAFSAAERVRFERDHLFPIAGLDTADVERHVTVERLMGDLQMVQADVARRYLDGDLEFVRAVTALEEQALVPHAEAAIKYINEYRSYVTTYTTGKAVFAARLATCAGPQPAEDARWRCFENLR